MPRSSHVNSRLLFIWFSLQCVPIALIPLSQENRIGIVESLYVISSLFLNHFMKKVWWILTFFFHPFLWAWRISCFHSHQIWIYFFLFQYLISNCSCTMCVRTVACVHGGMCEAQLRCENQFRHPFSEISLCMPLWFFQKDHSVANGTHHHFIRLFILSNDVRNVWWVN